MCILWCETACTGDTLQCVVGVLSLTVSHFLDANSPANVLVSVTVNDPEC